MKDNKHFRSKINTTINQSVVSSSMSNWEYTLHNHIHVTFKLYLKTFADLLARFDLIHKASPILTLNSYLHFLRLFPIFN